MRQFWFLILLLASTALATTHTFDTEYVPGQHSVILAWTCDDKADSQFVNIATEYGFSMTFAPYANTVTDINGDFDGNPYYDEWLIQWSKNKGMDFALHAQPNAPNVLAAGGRDSVEAVWAENEAFIREWSGVRAEDTGFVWVGHQNTPELRAMAKARGFNWTRGNAGAGSAPDLYINGGGWGNKDGAIGFYPPIMYHKSLVPSCSMYRLNTNGSSFSHVSTAADSAGWWAGTHIFLDSLHSKNGMAILNVHPGWTGTHRETISQDSSFARDTTVPNGNKIILRGRQGNTGRNDVSAYQIAYIMEAVAHWDSLKLDADGVRRVCILNMNELMSAPNIPFRTDDTNDPDVALANDFGASDSLDTYGVYTGDPNLLPKSQYKVYVDGTGDVVAGNGTATYPLPFGAWPYLFNCTVEFTGHAVGDTLTIKNGIDIPSGNVTYALNGLKLMPTTTGTWLKYYDSGGSTTNHYLRDIEWRDGTFDFGGLSTYGVSVGDVTSASTAILRPARVTFKGMTFTNGSIMLWPQQVYAMTVDSCFFTAGAVTGAQTQVIGGYGLYQPVIRNSVFDLTGAGNSSYMFDFGASATLTWEDSLAVLNNAMITGTGTHYAFRIRAQADLDSTTIGRQIRMGGNYFVSNKASTPTTLVTGPGLTTIASLEGQILRNAPTFADHANYYVGAWTGFDPLTDTSDTLRFGGSTSTGSRQTGRSASIGPNVFQRAPGAASFYGYTPTIALSNAQAGSVHPAAKMSFWQLHDLIVTRGVLAPCNPLDPDTYIYVSPPNVSDPAGLANRDLLLQEWKAWYDANAGDRGDIIFKF